MLPAAGYRRLSDWKNRASRFSDLNAPASRSYHHLMPFPQDVRFYQAMAYEADLISVAIESLDVQVPWSGAHLVGVGEPERFRPLFDAFTDYGGTEDALAMFTREIFCFGNVALFCFQGRAKAWPAAWSFDPNYHRYAAKGQLIEVRRDPVVGGFGTPMLEPALATFKRFWAQQDANIRALGAYVRNPRGRPPIGSARADHQAQHQVLAALGFTVQPNDIAHYNQPGSLRDEIKALFGLT